MHSATPQSCVRWLAATHSNKPTQRTNARLVKWLQITFLAVYGCCDRKEAYLSLTMLVPTPTPKKKPPRLVESQMWGGGGLVVFFIFFGGHFGDISIFLQPKRQFWICTTFIFLTLSICGKKKGATFDIKIFDIIFHSYFPLKNFQIIWPPKLYGNGKIFCPRIGWIFII